MTRVESEKTTNNRDLSKKERHVLQMAAQITPGLINEHPEIADLYKTTSLTRAQIAHLVLPNFADTFPDAARVAVGNVLRELIPKEERTRIARERRAANLRKRVKSMTEEEFVAHQKNAAAKRIEKYGTNIDSMIRGRGRVPWTDSEKAFAQFLASQPAFQHHKGPGVGKPNYLKIADALNQAFHIGNPIRTTSTVKAFFIDTHRKERRSQQ